MGGEPENVVQIGHPKEEVNYVKDGNQHQAIGSGRVKLTFALKEYCSILLCSTVVIAATHAHVGLLDYLDLNFRRNVIQLSTSSLISS